MLVILSAASLLRSEVDVLVGNPDLAVEPVCETGFGYGDCRKGHCLYRSRFESGYVPLGSFGKDNSLVNSVKHIALNKIFPPHQGLFLQGEILGVSPVAVEKAAEHFDEVPKDLNLSFREELEDSKKLLEDFQFDDGTTGGSNEENEQDTLPDGDLKDRDSNLEEHVFKLQIQPPKLVLYLQCLD